MQFDSIFFLLFLALVALVYQAIPNWNARKAWLVFVSYVFYAAWRPELTILLLISTTVDWYAARRISEYSGQTQRRLWLAVSLITNLGLLTFFKYSSFFISSFNDLSQLVRWDVDVPALDILLPIGISFYTFQTLSYTIDAYRGKLKANYSLLDFSLFVSFFPQLVAGPIVRATQFLPQLKRKRRISRERLSRGLILFLFGLFSKVVLADSLLSPIVDRIYSSESLSFIDSFSATLAFSGQIYFDFSGYTSCALGIAMLLGFTLPSNFNAPYAAAGFSDFWSRWHITLSSWLRDYLYIPLGGNRKGSTRTTINLMIVMSLGGLWHGAAWHFVLWGVLHGLYLIIEHVLLGLFPALKYSTGTFAYRAFTFIIVSLTWVLFRANDLHQAKVIYTGFSRFDASTLISSWEIAMTFVAITAMFIWQQLTRSIPADKIFSGLPVLLRSLIVSIAIISIYIASKEESRAFIYFQF